MENSIARIAVIDNHLKMFPRFFSVGKIASFVHGNTLVIREKAEVGRTLRLLFNTPLAT